MEEAWLILLPPSSLSIDCLFDIPLLMDGAPGKLCFHEPQRFLVLEEMSAPGLAPRNDWPPTNGPIAESLFRPFIYQEAAAIDG